MTDTTPLPGLDEAVEAAAKAEWSRSADPDFWAELTEDQCELWRGPARTALIAAYPLIAAVVREQVAQEIEGEAARLRRRGWASSAATVRLAAHIARGGAR